MNISGKLVIVILLDEILQQNIFSISVVYTCSLPLKRISCSPFFTLPVPFYISFFLSPILLTVAPDSQGKRRFLEEKVMTQLLAFSCFFSPQMCEYGPGLDPNRYSLNFFFFLFPQVIDFHPEWYVVIAGSAEGRVSLLLESLSRRAREVP